MKLNLKWNPKDWSGIWSLTWRYFLWAPVVVPLGALLLVVMCAVVALPPAIAMSGLVTMIFIEGFRVYGAIVFVVSSLATYLIWRYGAKYLDFRSGGL